MTDAPAVEPNVRSPWSFAHALRRGLFADTAGTVALNGSTIVLGFGATLLLSRILGVSGYGAYAFAFAWASVLAVPALLGLTPLVIRHVAAYRAREEWGPLRGILRRSNQAVALSAGSLVALGAVLGWAAHRSEPELVRPFWIGLLLVPIIALTALRQAAMQGLGRVVVGRLPETIVAPALFIVLIGGGALVGDALSPSSAIALQVVAAAVAFAIGAYLLRGSLPAAVRLVAPAYETHTWARSALPLFAMSGVTAVNAQVGTIFLGALEGPEEAGIYGVASRVAVFTSFVALAATYPLMPAAARVYATQGRDELQRLVARSARVVALASIPLIVGLVVFAEPCLRLFGGDFEQGANALRLMALGEGVKVSLGFGGLALVMTGREGQLTKAVAAGAAATLLLNPALIPFFGVEGAALATAAGATLTALIAAVLAWTRLGIYAPAFGALRKR